MVWHDEGPQRFSRFAPKTNGWELGEAGPAFPGAQGRAHTEAVRQVAATVTVSVDGAPVVEFTDTDPPYPAGSVGVHTEDAEVEFGDLTASALP